MKNIVTAIGLLGWASALATPALAGSIALKCEAHDVGAASAAGPGEGITMTYDGDTSGTLTVTGPFGEMVLPANKELAEGAVEGVNDGKPYTGMGIRASGPVVVLMPDKSAIESCVSGKLKTEEVNDADLVFMATMSCTASAAPGAQKVPVIASVEIASVDPA